MKQIIVATSLVWSLMSGQTAWQFKPAPTHGDFFGPATWILGEDVQLTVKCYRYSRRSQTPSDPYAEPKLPPRELTVSAIWIPRSTDPANGDPATLVGSTDDPTALSLTHILIGIDDEPPVKEEWITRFGRHQQIEGPDAESFVEALLPQRRMVSVSAEFTDGTTRTGSFDVSPVPEMLRRMAPECAVLEKLLQASP